VGWLPGVGKRLATIRSSPSHRADSGCQIRRPLRSPPHAKGEGEALLEASGVPTVIFRSDHIYGPPDDPGPTASSFPSKEGKPVTVLGRGTQRMAPNI
jgi:nucleoside-diphosphate-sugar epimerase